MMKNVQLSSALKNAKFQEVKVETLGRIFEDKKFAKDWDSIYVNPSELDYGVAKKGMRKIVSPTLIMASHSSRVAFVWASEEEPVFVCSGCKFNPTIGYLMLFELKLLTPEYVYYLSKYETWVGAIEDADKYGLGSLGWSEVGTVLCGPEFEIITAECVFRNEINRTIPIVSIQEQQISDVKVVEAKLQEKIKEKELKFQQKEWLNEAHIRNSKHKLSHIAMELRMPIERLKTFFEQNTNGVKYSDIIGKRTNQTIENLMCELINSMDKMSEEIINLTKTDCNRNDIHEINLSKELDEYLNATLLKFDGLFRIERIGFDEDYKIKLSKKDFIELLDNIINNAVRHGFVNGSADYKIQVSIESIRGEMCRISIANNGEPMSERAIETYFEQGSFAGKTGNTGIGGNRIFDICDKAGGQALKPYEKEGYPVVISVEFPIV